LLLLLAVAGTNKALAKHVADFIVGHLCFIGSIDKQKDGCLGAFDIAYGALQPSEV